jgi:hypothetical protein
MRTILGLLALAAGLWANTNATLTGRVTDPSGSVIAKVEVRAINVETSVKQSAETKYPLPRDVSAENVITRTVTPFGGGARRTLPAFGSVLRSGPLDAGAGLPQDTYAGSMRMDSTLNTRTTLMARYSARDSQQFAPVRQPYSPELDQKVLQRHQAASITLTRIWSPGLVSESRLAFNRYSVTGRSFPARSARFSSD